MRALLELRWQFTPSSFFEQPLEVKYLEANISVDDGVVVARLPYSGGEIRSPLRAAVEAQVEALFLGVQVAEDAKFELSAPTVNTLHEDGSRGHIIECASGSYQFRGGRPDLRYTNSDGTVVDTRQDRLDRKRRLSLAAAKYAPNDAALARMLRSYRSALLDRQDELIHLYEVIDTLTGAFGSQTEALRNLRIPKRSWSRLGQICNELPLHEGRHRGRIKEPLRNATEAELAEARALSSAFVEAYVTFLDG